jgi:hypothetical protein
LFDPLLSSLTGELAPLSQSSEHFKTLVTYLLQIAMRSHASDSMMALAKLIKQSISRNSSLAIMFLKFIIQNNGSILHDYLFKCYIDKIRTIFIELIFEAAGICFSEEPDMAILRDLCDVLASS